MLCCAPGGQFSLSQMRSLFCCTLVAVGAEPLHALSPASPTSPAPPPLHHLQVRTEAYRDALEKNPSLMRGAKLLDVGCGTGILSMCAARGGAAAVVGIDGSEQMSGPGCVWCSRWAVSLCWLHLLP